MAASEPDAASTTNHLDDNNDDNTLSSLKQDEQPPPNSKDSPMHPKDEEQGDTLVRDSQRIQQTTREGVSNKQNDPLPENNHENKSDQESSYRVTTDDDEPHHDEEDQDSDDDDDDEHAPLFRVVQEWGESSTVHGMNVICDSHHVSTIWKRLLWFFLVIASASVMVWQMTALIREYREYAVVTETQTILDDTLEFPEITICNINEYSQAASRIVAQEQQQDDDWILPRTTPQLERMAQPLEEFVQTLSFQQQVIDKQDFAQVWKRRITDFGPCWAFAPPPSQPRSGSSSSSSTTPRTSTSGLEFSVYLNQSDYTSRTEFAGILLVAQLPGTLVHEVLPFVVVPPGTVAWIALEATQMVREREPPWSQCHSQAPEYTQAQCRAQCLHASFRRDCHCRYWGDPVTNDKDNAELPYCTTNQDQVCMEGIWDREQDVVQQSCACELPPCQDTQYHMSVSDLVLATESQQESFNATTTDDGARNLVSVRIPWGSTPVTRLVEQKAVTFAELLGSIGGSMGLFLGISALSMFEIFGDLCVLRLLPRVCGYRHVRGWGAAA